MKGAHASHVFRTPRPATMKTSIESLHAKGLSNVQISAITGASHSYVHMVVARLRAACNVFDRPDSDCTKHLKLILKAHRGGFPVCNIPATYRVRA